MRPACLSVERTRFHLSTDKAEIPLPELRTPARPSRRGSSGLLILNPAIGTADYADDADEEAFADDGDLTGSVSNGGENGGCKFLNP
jgi:hypothetical protein